MPEVTATRYLVTAGWDDVPHLDAKTKKELWDSSPPHEREARARGIPTLGSGRIFPVEEDSIKVSPFKIPEHWTRINGLDFGWDHPTAAVQLAIDVDADCIYVTHAHRQDRQLPAVHAMAIKAWGPWVPTAWPHDGLQHDKGGGEQLAVQYAATGLLMLKDRATFEDGGNSVEAGLMDMLERMQTGRFKVFSHLSAWFDEFRLYHRKDGKVVKKVDDLMCLHPETTVITSRGHRRIVDLVGERGSVLSVGGEWAEFHSCRMTRQNADLVRVHFSDGFSLVCTPDHKLLTDDGAWVEAVDSAGCVCHHAVSHGDYTQWKKSTLTGSVSRASGTTGGARGNSFTERFGSFITGKFQRVGMSTTRMRTARTMTSRISNSCTAESIFRGITKGMADALNRLWMPCQRGAQALLANSPCPSPASATPSTCASPGSSSVNSAASATRQRKQAEIASAPTLARAPGAALPGLIAGVLYAAFAAWSSKRQSPNQPRRVRDLVGASFGSQHQKVASTLRVLRVESAGKSDVYCMEVPRLHAFAVGNGAIVHNCATRYAVMMKRKAKTRPAPTANRNRGAWQPLDREIGY